MESGDSKTTTGDTATVLQNTDNSCDQGQDADPNQDMDATNEQQASKAESTQNVQVSPHLSTTNMPTESVSCPQEVLMKVDASSTATSSTTSTTTATTTTSVPTTATTSITATAAPATTTTTTNVPATSTTDSTTSSAGTSTTNLKSCDSNHQSGAQTQQQTQQTNQTPSTTFFPLTRSRMRENLDNQEIIDIRNIVDGSEFAEKARLKTGKLTEEEYNIFSDLIQDDVDIFHDYTLIRDNILKYWYEDCQFELTHDRANSTFEAESSVYSLLKKPEMTRVLFDRTFHFLDRTGRINFGMLQKWGSHNQQQQESSDQAPSSAQSPGPSSPQSVQDRNPRAVHMASHLYKPPLKSSKRTSRVIVIGAGLSGLMAAKQLQRFGMEVIVLEARNRCGGRIQTYKRGQFIADMGPSSLNGVTGNPLVPLAKQLDLGVVELKQKIPIYESKMESSHQVEQLFERAVEREYNKILEGTRVIKNDYNIDKYHGQYFPVGQAVNWVMTLQEKNIKDEQIKYLKMIEESYQMLTKSSNHKLEQCITIKKLHGQLCSIKDSIDIGNHNDKSIIDTFNRRSLARDLSLALQEYKIVVKLENDIKLQIAAMTKSPPSDTYLSLCDRRLLDWHFAELEYALGCPINKLSPNYEDDEDIFPGSHWMLVNGFSSFVDGLKQGLDVSLNTAVKKITVTKNGCNVLTYNPDQSGSNYKELTADAVLCTLPLGLLQDSVVASRQASLDPKSENYQRTPQRGYQPVIFSPPLPRWKTSSINKLGCGNLNKIILNFDKVFWNPALHLFGVVNHKAIARGEFFLFWHHGRSPTLTGLLSGDAADFAERMSDLEILERCLQVLRSIYTVSSVPAPKDYVVTRWRKDTWAKGAWSFLQVGASGKDFETCAEPVVLESDEQAFKEFRLSQRKENFEPISLVRATSNEDIPRLYFAGEHTTKHYFASAHGAILTGLREAARIANAYLGCPYDPENEPGVIVF